VRVEGLELVAVLGQHHAAVGEDAVHVEYQQAHATRARSRVARALHARRSSVSVVSAAIATRVLRPTTSSSRAGARPVPGALVVSMKRSMAAPAGMSTAATSER